MELKNTFVQSKMNKDIDERLLPKGQYPDAQNIRVANSDSSDAGAIENVKGNEKLTDLNLTNARCIGVVSDGFNEKLYWFVTSDEKDLMLEYNFINSELSTILEASSGGVLNFSEDYLITGAVKVINGDSDRDVIVWTDDLNGIRMVNIERGKTYGPDGFIEDDISLIKKPPRYAPETSFLFSDEGLDNNIEDEFLTFSYRYKYLDGEYSALSSYTNYQFSPKPFDLDYQTMENKGMVNNFNAIKVEFNTGSKRVTDVQLIVKKSNSNALAIVGTFNKKDEGWLDNEIQSFTFSNSKRYVFLPEDELFRAYDNVPRKAKALEMVGNRLMIGNYLEGYDLVNDFGEQIPLDYDLSVVSNDIVGVEIPLELSNSVVSDDTLEIDLSGISLKKDTRLDFNIRIREVTYGNGTYEGLHSFVLNKDFVSVIELTEDEDFIYFLETVVTQDFLDNNTADPPPNGAFLSSTPFTVVDVTGDVFSIKTPTITYDIDSGSSQETSNWAYLISFTQVFYKTTSTDSSVKSNRSYEVGIIYLDEYNRASTVLVDKDNTVKVPQDLSTSRNVINVTVNHLPPYWADRYKFVVKQNKGDYQTIYTNIFYEDGQFRWVKLEGANKDKVKEGDTLIVKSDLGGPLEEPVKVRVLEVDTKIKNFLEENENEDGDEIIEEAGLYMKIKPSGFDMNFNDATARTFEGSSHLRYTKNTYTSPLFGEDDSLGNFQPYEINAGTTIKIYIRFKARGSIAYEETYEKTFKASSDYLSVEDWFNAEVNDLGSFGDNFTSDYGFSANGDSFYVKAHRDGTASRKITTTVRFEILFSEGTVIFETEPEEIDNSIYYETEQTFDIIDGYHQGNLGNQSFDNPSAFIEMDFFNCYVQGNGAESYRYKDAFNSNYLNIDLRPSATSVEGFREIRRYADVTYSEPYNENTNVNGLNEFNLAKANYKEDIDKKYGSIQKMFSRDTNLLIFQEDKVSYILFGKDLLMNADGSSSITSIEDVLGQQIMYAGEYGISRNPESFAFDANNIYWVDPKRGAVLRLAGDGINEISKNGLRTYFKDQYKDSINTQKLGSYDPFFDQYVLHNDTRQVIPEFDINCSGSVIKTGYQGTLSFNIDYGLLIGSAGFDYSSNGKPVRYTIEWNGGSITTGFRGDSQYNSDLSDLGLPNVVGAGTGQYRFTKGLSLPRTAKVTVEAPLCDTDFNIQGVCVDSPELTVVTVILNDEEDLDLTMKSRYKWKNPSYISPYTNFDTTFDEEELELLESVTGNEGDVKIPLSNGTVEMESFKGFSQTASFLEGNQLGYLVSDTVFNELNYSDLISQATFVVPTEETLPNGDVINKMNFQFLRPSSEQFLYLIWDYRNEKLQINRDTKIRIYFDSSGSMNSSLAPLQTMRDTILKDRLLPLYDNDSALYDSSVAVLENPTERTLHMLNLEGDTPEGNVIALIFQDEANVVYHAGLATFDENQITAQYEQDVAALRGRLFSFPQDYYRGVIFQVEGFGAFKPFVTAVKDGNGAYAGVKGLSDRTEFNYKFDIADGGTPQYYLDQIVNALTELGYEL